MQNVNHEMALALGAFP